MTDDDTTDHAARVFTDLRDKLHEPERRESATAEQDETRRGAAERLRVAHEHTTSDEQALQAVQAVQEQTGPYMAMPWTPSPREPVGDVPSLSDVLAMLGESAHECGGNERKRAKTGIGCGVEISHWGLCEACGLAVERAAFERQALQAARATIPNHFRWARFGAPELAQRVTPSALEAALEIVRSRRLPKALAIVGKASTGKTSLACALLRRVHDAVGPKSDEVLVAKAASAMFVSSSEMIHETRYLERGAEPRLMRRALGASLLVLDDVGLHNDPENLVRTLLEARANASQPTIVTTAFTRETMTRRYGDGLSKRLYQVVISC